jgi:hypothetical protein
MSIVCSASVVIPINSDLNPPQWRGQAGSTFARWEFVTDTTTIPAWDEGENLFGQTVLTVYPAAGHTWIQTLDGAAGLWPLSGEIVVDIDNRKMEGPAKLFRIQLVWKPKWSVTTPYVSITDDQNLKLENIAPSFEMAMPDRPLWTYSVYDVTWERNPFRETIMIAHDIYVDALIIDTWCIPEPSTYCILMAGALFLYRVRK